MVIMARRFGKKRRSAKAKAIPLAVMVPLAYIGYDVGKKMLAGQFNDAAYIMTGYKDGSFNPGRLAATYGPTVAGAVVHKVANKFGVNNMVRRATMGWLSI